MSHYEMQYKSADRQANDDAAIQDIREYLGKRAWQSALDLANVGTIQQINIGLALAGVSGYPFHAFCRRYRLADYRAWMAEGDDGVETDDEGFPVEAA